jgi:multidrug efflux pump subunit AcrB
MARLDKEGLTQDLDTDFKVGFPELDILPNRDEMARRSVNIDTVARTLRSTVAGTPFSRFTGDGRRYDIRVKLRDDEVRSAENIGKIEVRNQFGNQIPLSKLVTFKEVETFQAINRLNRQRSVGVYGNLSSGQSQQTVLSRAQAIAQEVLPVGYRFSLEGAAAGLTESFKSLLLAMILGIIVAYMILATQFNSFVHPIAVLVALPFSLTGAFLILWMFGVSLNLFSMIGIIVLMGIAKKNSILLVEFTNHTRAHGERDVRKALLEACPVRLRPILMTSVATVAAAIPLAIGNSIGQETRTPMGLVIIGGTIVSTLFTLFVVPCIYLMLSKLERNKPHDPPPHLSQT